MISALYVDDEPLLLEIAKKFLERDGEFRIDVAQSVDEALGMMEKKKYDAVISDYQMPRRDGLEFLSQIRDAGNDIPFILFTGRGREDVVIRAINTGADFYIQKGGDPGVQFAELVHKIRIAVDRRSQTDEIVRKNEELKEINRKLRLAEDELKAHLGEVSRKRWEAAESANRLQQIITFLPDPTFAIDMGGQVIAWNSAIERLSGVPADDIIGKGDYEYSYRIYGKRRPILIDLLLHPDLEKDYSFPPVMSSGNQIYAERFFSSLKEEKKVYGWFTASPLYDMDGNIAGAIESIRDITSIKRTERLLEIQRDLGIALGKTVTLKETVDAVLKSADALDDTDLCGIYLADPDSGILRLEASKGESNKFKKRVSFLFPKNKCLKSDYWLRDLCIDETHFEDFNPEWMREEGIKSYYAAKFIYENELLGLLVCASGTADEIPQEMKTSIETIATQASGALFRSRVSEERRKSRENLENFCDEIEDYLYVTDTSGFILMTNTSLQKYTGYREDELTGNHISMIHPPEYKDEVGVVFNGITKANLGSHFIPVMTKTGETAPAETRVSPGRWGGSEAIFAVSRNISGLKKAHDEVLESERRFRAVFDQSFQLAGILDKKGRILYVNKTMLKFAGLDYEECKGKYIWDLDMCKGRTALDDKIMDSVRVALGGVTVKGEFNIPDADGILRSLDVSIRPVRDDDGNVIYIVPEAVETTRRKKAEEALLQANHKLLLLNSITRHDILNRVTPVLGFLELAKDSSENPVMAEMIEKLRLEVTDIENLIKFTGFYDELGAAKPSWQNPGKIIGSLNVPKGIKVRCDLPEIEVYADPMLEKVFSNLLDNSLMHGSGVSEIAVSCRSTDEGTSIFWKDNGRGIPDLKKEKIFLRGFGDNSGLGLFLSKEILSITGIDIRECGKEGEGALFEIIIPADGCRPENGETNFIEEL